MASVVIVIDQIKYEDQRGTQCVGWIEAQGDLLVEDPETLYPSVQGPFRFEETWGYSGEQIIYRNTIQIGNLLDLISARAYDEIISALAQRLWKDAESMDGHYPDPAYLISQGFEWVQSALGVTYLSKCRIGLEFEFKPLEV